MAQVPYALEFLHRLTLAIEAITWTDHKGVEWTMADSVYRGRVQFGEDDALPLVSILEVPLQPEQEFSGSDGAASKGSWQLVVQGFVQDDHRNPTDPAHYLLAAVKAALVKARREARGDGIFGLPRVTDLTFNRGVVRPPDETSAVAHFWLTVYVQMVENNADPYVETP